jgi:hypothetical protein
MAVQYDSSKLNDFELAMISVEINCCYHRIEQLNELLNKVGEVKECLDTGKASHQTANEPNQTTTDFDKLPWKSYKTKQDAKTDEAAWIFANTKGAETLLATLKSNNEKVQLGNFEYSVQGPERQFIARKPVK